ncbi:riboflavin synthase alpha chain [Candidatus Scalindua japonica]|uniref:Riboflavin synthase alpha chain n=1 Tax=Candidatus Scalindua japonica TaxID=1284222 RepID=A0A286TYU4_9BACT|nr:cytochrome c [Candidatus Scalindua japonica]GAX60991.1 riboflavin synthase alpha chain [Candidatus Scalindua japonica]
MKSSLIILVLIIGTLIVIASCKKPEEVKIENAIVYTPLQDDLARSMKKASLVMRRLFKAVKNNDWVEIDMWTQELKDGIGFTCITQYMREKNDISLRFIMLSNQFNSAINKLTLASKKHYSERAKLEFNNLVYSCDACHDSFNKDAEGKLDFSE